MDVDGSTTRSSRPDRYIEWRPARELTSHVACLWAQRLPPDAPPHVHRVVPDGCVDLICTGSEVHVAGPDTGPVLVSLAPGSRFVGLRLRPGVAPALLGVPTSAIRDARVDLEEFWAGEARRLGDAMAGTSAISTATGLLENAAGNHLLGPVDPVARAAAAELDRSDGPSMASTADRLGVSERQLRRRCVAAFGYGPKTLARVLRFHRAVTSVQSGYAGSLADLAAGLGYADQAHLAREVRRLAGAPLTRL